MTTSARAAKPDKPDRKKYGHTVNTTGPDLGIFYLGSIIGGIAATRITEYLKPMQSCFLVS